MWVSRWVYNRFREGAVIRLRWSVWVGLLTGLVAMFLYKSLTAQEENAMWQMTFKVEGMSSAWPGGPV